MNNQQNLYRYIINVPKTNKKRLYCSKYMKKCYK